VSLVPSSTVGDPLPVEPLRAVRRRLACSWSPTEVALALRDEPHSVALVGRWFDGSSVVATRPLVVRRPGRGPDPFALLDDLPPLVETPGDGVFGGWIGYLGFQAGRLVERLPGPPPRPHPLPEWWLGWYDHVLRRDRAGIWWLEALVPAGEEPAPLPRHRELLERLRGDPPRPQPLRWTPFRPTPSGDDHRKAIHRVLELIGAGDIYQANVCLRLSATLEEGRPVDVFTAGADRLHPSYAAYLDLGPDEAVTSFSPERFLRRRGREVHTSPIKGTRPRDPRLGDDDPARDELATSAKERAENVMIVDLMRNDLGRVCKPGSIHVPRLLAVEPHPGVWHLVSDVTGTLTDDIGDGSSCGPRSHRGR
jgi:para-aminobenzoate synthetase / 4-amino-4-deoxychorismate lyase